MGFHPPWKYETVIELVFDSGILKFTFDRSEQMAEIRDLVIKSANASSSTGMPSMDEIKELVKQAFDRSYAKEDTSG
jgi:hypothetical protein